MYPIDFFWRAAQRWPTRTAIDTSEDRISYAELAARVRAVAAELVAIDPGLQTRVGICAKNNAEHIVSLLAVLACGKIWVPLNPRSTRPEIERILAATEPSILIVDEACLHLVEEPSARLIINQATSTASGKSNRQTESITALIERCTDARQPVFELAAEATQAIKFTGGTTGLPKGVMQPYRAWMTNIVNQIATWDLNENDRYVVAAPITHGTSTYMLPILAQGGCHLILEETSPRTVTESFRERGGTVCFMPPTLIYMLMAQPGVSRADFPSLKRLIYGGAPMPPGKIAEVRKFFGPVLGTTYGQTEAPQIVTAMRPEDFDEAENWASVGRTTWFSQTGIMAPDGSLLPPGKIGEVVVRGELVMTGYWRLPEKTAETLVGGWLHTGDRGLIDERGYLYLKDRIRDVVITGGFNVYPVDVENALGRHEAVHECSVFGVPDDKWGEAVQAAVQLREGTHATEQALIEHVKALLGSVQAPKKIHFYDILPRSPVGKILKMEVRRHAIEALNANTASLEIVS